MLNVLCFGDSITLGEKDLEEGGWADRLKKDYFYQYQNHPIQEVTIYNLGIAGETTDGLVGRFEREFNARKIRRQNTLVILAYGANDIVIHKNKNIVPEGYFLRNLISCINLALTNNSQVLLLSLLPISDTNELEIDSHGNLRTTQDIIKYNQWIKNLSEEKNCNYLNVYTSFIDFGKEKLLAKDGVHPNSKGHQILYQLIKQKLIEIF